MSGFDSNWHRRALAGDRDAIETLVKSVLTPLHSFCLYRVGRNRALCEEVVQETILRAVNELDKYDPSRSANNIFPWLIGIACNEIHRAVASEKVTVSLESLWAGLDRQLQDTYSRLETASLDDDCLQRQETRELVNATMSQLPRQYQSALEARYFHGRSTREISALTHVSEKAVESQLARAREAFRATFLALVRQLEHGSVGGVGPVDTLRSSQ